ncbi:MAG: DUF87 domain-containing protein [Candidatus Helarchaeota archaeon]|nr:DUF87 domain-containing protein [Candidatus Helarchaeota archaeon]
MGRLILYLQRMELFILLTCNICYLLTFIDLFKLKVRREAEINRIERPRREDGPANWVKFLRTFAITTFINYLIFSRVFAILYDPSSFNLHNFLVEFFNNPLILSFIIQICLFIGIQQFLLRAKQVFAKEILVTRELTRVQKLFLAIEVVLIINLGTLIAFFIIGKFFASSFFVIIENINIVVFFGLLVSIGIYFLSRYLIDLNFSKIQKDIVGEDIFTVSNSIRPKFYKAFMVLKILGVKANESFEINFRILKFIKELVVEVKFSRNSNEIYIWVFADGVHREKLYGKLRSVAEEFNSLFPATEIRILKQDEIEDLLDLKSDFIVLKSKKKVGLDFLNYNSSVNKMDELLQMLTTFGQEDLEGSIIFSFKLQDLPKTLLKKKEFRLNYAFNQRAGHEGIYQKRDSFDIGLQKRTDFEVKVHNRAFATGSFQFDMHVLLKNTLALGNNYFREKIAMKLKEFIFKIYNIDLRQLNRIEKLFLNEKRIKLRQKISKDVFLLSGDQLINLLTFPSAPHLDLKVTKVHKFNFPPPCLPEDAPVILGKLEEHKNQRGWTFPLSELSRSMVILGIPGMGKTTFILNLLKELKKYQVPFMVFDIKLDYMDIFDETTLLLRPGLNFFINMFAIKERDPETHAAFLFNLIVSMFPPEEFSPVVQELLLNSLENTCQDLQKRNIEGFWRAVDEEGEKLPPRNRMEIKAALRVRLASFFRGSMGKVLSDTPLDIYELFDHNIIVDLNYFQNVLGASFTQLHFLARLILQYLTYKNLGRAHINKEGLKHICVIDDATAYFKRSENDETSFLKVLIQLCRKMQQGLIISNQSPDGLDLEVVEYPNNMVCFRHADRLGVSRNALGLPANQKILTELEKYIAIVKTNQSPTPFRIHTIPFNTTSRYSFDEMSKITQQNLEQLFPVLSQGTFKEISDNKTPPLHLDNDLREERGKGLINKMNFKNCKIREKSLKHFFEELTQNQEIREILRLNIELGGFLTIKQVEKLLTALNDSRLDVVKNKKSKSRIRGFINVLTNRDNFFCKKKMGVNEKNYTILINSKYSQIYDTCENFLPQHSGIKDEDLIIQYNRNVFLNEIRDLNQYRSV